MNKLYLGILSFIKSDSNKFWNQSIILFLTILFPITQM